jgi:aryl-alcohol dehydrogenase-like predicted oxidoreductase
MKERNVGKSGLRVSTVGLGCNNFGWSIDASASEKVIGRAIDLGITLFDVADFYGKPPGSSETVLGRILGPRRKEIVLATKFGIDFSNGGKRRDSSRRHVLRAVEDSLRRLNTDWIDVYMIHFPDPSTPMQETLRALDDLVRSGKVRYIGCSNLGPWKIVEAMWIARELNTNAFVASESEYSLLSRGVEQDLIPALSAYGLGLFPYYPLAGGLLSGKYVGGANTKVDGRLANNFLGLGNRFLTEQNIARTESLQRCSAERGYSLLELALGWLGAQPTVSSIIAGATRPEQVEQNVRAAERQLSPEDLVAIDGLCDG